MSGYEENGRASLAILVTDNGYVRQPWKPPLQEFLKHCLCYRG